MEKKWTTVIEPKARFFDLKLKEIWKYRDLIGLFVKRNISTRYKQTILGPLWFIIQPLLTTIIHTIVFGSIVNLTPGEDGAIAPFLFQLSGSIPWAYFAACLNGTSNTFVGNAGIFGKVYFPRMVTPISTVLTNMVDFALQFGLMAIVQTICMLGFGNAVCPTWELFLLPVIVLQMALLGMGIGTIISSLTTKYRDLQVLVGFGVSLLMYITPVVYQMSTIPADSTFYTILMLNPMTPIMEMFRYMTLGVAGSINWMYWGISWATTLVVLLLGMLIFNKIERNFMDTV